MLHLHTVLLRLQAIRIVLGELGVVPKVVTKDNDYGSQAQRAKDRDLRDDHNVAEQPSEGEKDRHEKQDRD